jgi:hypothetical protein
MQYADGYLLGVLVSAFFLTLAKILYPVFLSVVWRAMVSYSDSYKIYRDHNFMLRRIFALTGFVVTLNISLFLSFLFYNWHISLSPWGALTDFGLIFVSVGLLSLLKRLLLRTVGQLFMAYRMAEEYWFQQSIINRFAAVLALPLLASLPYLSEWLSVYFVNTVWGIVAMAYLYRVIRSMRMTIEKQFSVLYMLFYFLTLEIIPVLVLVKFFTMRWV